MTKENELLAMIAARLRMPPRNDYGAPSKLGFDFIHVHEVDSAKYLIFVASRGGGVVLEDGANFPSDSLMAQLRLLQ